MTDEIEKVGEPPHNPKSEATEPKRRWYQYELRTLVFVVMPIFAILSAISASYYHWWNIGQQEISWQPFSQKSLDTALSEDKTVLVHFTARWSNHSMLLETFALETPKVRRLIWYNNVVPLKADWTEREPEVDNALRSVGFPQIPTIAIYCKGNLDKPFVIQGLFSSEDVARELERCAQ